MAGDGHIARSAEPSVVTVRAHLSGVLQHHEFSASPQLVSFLTYIVERKIEGAEDRIKAYSIATEALGRPASFDPQADPIVRVQAGRLRQALQAYYNSPDADTSMRIELSVGSYVPHFFAAKAAHPMGPPSATQPAGPATGKRRAPAWLVLGLVLTIGGLLFWQNRTAIRAEFDSIMWTQPPTEGNPLDMPAIVVSAAQERQVPGWFSPELFAKGVETNLSKFDEFVVLAPVANQPLADTDYRLDLVFTGQTSSVLGTVRLVRGRSGQIVWSNRFTVPEDSIDSYELLDPVRKISSTIGQPYGVLYAQVLSDPNRTADQVCLLSGYEWFQVPERSRIEAIGQCLDDMMKRKPGNHVAYMMRAYMHVANYRTGQGLGPEAELSNALTMAKRAVALRPESAGTRQAMMEVQWARGKFAFAEEEGRTAAALNPNSSDVVADFGCRLIYEGKYSEGETYARRAARLNSQPPIWHAFCLFIAAYNTGNFAAAAQVADSLEGHPAPEASIPVILMAMRGGDTEKARRALSGLLVYEQSDALLPGEVLARIGLFPDVAKPIADQLTQAMTALKQ